MKILFTIVIIFSIFVLWIGIDYSLGRRKHYVTAKKNTTLMRQSDIHLFTSGPNLFEDLFDLCRNAKQHIHISFYIVKNDQISKEFLTILTEQAAKGVEVRLLLDFIGSISVSRKSLKELQTNGGQFAFCHLPKFPYFFHSLQVRNHRKISIIDGKVGYVGGYNVGKEYINEDPILNPWRDYHIKITGEGVQDLQTTFLIDWCNATHNDLLQYDKYFPPLQKGSIEHQLVPSQGVSIEAAYSKLIREAKQFIFIGTPYFIPSDQLVNDLLTALKRGVKVTILVPYKADHLFVKEASFPSLRKLLNYGANVYEYLKGFYHAKVILIDDTVCDIGTANFDKRSLFINYEINCYIYNHDFLTDIHEVVNKDIANAQPLTLEKLNSKKGLQSIREFIATTFSHFL